MGTRLAWHGMMWMRFYRHGQEIVGSTEKTNFLTISLTIKSSKKNLKYRYAFPQWLEST